MTECDHSMTLSMGKRMKMIKLNDKVFMDKMKKTKKLQLREHQKDATLLSEFLSPKMKMKNMQEFQP